MGKEIIVGIDYIISIIGTESVFDSLHATVIGTNVIVDIIPTVVLDTVVEYVIPYK